MQHFTSPQQPMIFSFGVTPCCLASLTLTGPMLRAPLQVAQQSGNPQVSHPPASPDLSIKLNSLNATCVSYTRSRPLLTAPKSTCLPSFSYLTSMYERSRETSQPINCTPSILWSLASFLASSLTSRPSSLFWSSVLSSSRVTTLTMS